MNKDFGINIIPNNEDQRSLALKRYHILDTLPEKVFNNMAKLAADVFRVPLVHITFIDTDKVYHKAAIGGDIVRTLVRRKNICSLVVLNKKPTVFNDTLEEPVLNDIRHLLYDTGVRFFAGAPLITPDGFIIGCISIASHTPQAFSDHDEAILAGMANVVMEQLELRLLAVTNSKQEKATKDTLVKNESRLRYMLAEAPIAIALLNGRDLIVESANKKMLEAWGKDESVISKPLKNALPELQGQPFLQLLDNVFTSGQPHYGNEVKVLLEQDGKLQELYANFVYQPLKNENGETVDILLVAIETTEQVLARKKIEASEHRLKSMIMTAPVGITILKGKDLVVEIANQPILDIWSRTEEQVIGKRLLYIFPELNDQPYPQILTNVFDTGQSVYIPSNVTYVAVPGGGTRKLYINFSYDPLFDVDGNVEAVMVTVINITDTVISMQRLEQAEERLRMAVDITGLATADIDPKTSTLICSDRYAQIFGFDSADSLTKADFYKLFDPEDYAEVIQPALENAYTTGQFSYDARVVLPNEPLKWVRVKGRLLYDDDGNPSRIMSTMLDVTEQKEDEARKNDFIAMVSHELKTPLTSLKAYLQMLQMRAEKTTDNFTIGALSKTLLQVDKMTALIKGFLDVARLESGKIHLNMQTFNLNELLSEVVEDNKLLSQSHNIIFPPCEKINIHADRDKIAQVINNFISNAIKYSPKGKNINVNCLLTAYDVHVSIQDEGMGIQPKDMDKLFDRFYRVQSKNTQTISGFGIGLYLCAEIIQRHKGKIWVESQVGKGSTFHFSLPLLT